jgi:hypothetical protein
MTQSLTEYFNNMKNQVNACESCEKNSDGYKIFLSLCELGVRLESNTFTALTTKDELTKITEKLLNNILPIISSSDKKILDVYYQETKKVINGEYQFKLPWPLSFQKTPDEDKKSMELCLTKIKKALDDYVLVSSQTDTDAASSSQKTIDNDKNPLLEAQRLVLAFMAIRFTAHERRAACLAQHLLACQNVETMKNLIQQQLDLKINDSALMQHGFLGRWRHYRAWHRNNEALNTAWQQKHSLDTYAAVLETLKTQLT